MADELHRLTAHEARTLLSNREVSSVELTQAVLDRIAMIDDKLGAYITVSEESALAQAADADKSLSNGGAGLLTGVPVRQVLGGELRHRPEVQTAEVGEQSVSYQKAENARWEWWQLPA